MGQESALNKRESARTRWSGLALHPAQPADFAVIAGWVPDRDACLRWAGPRLAYPFRVEALPALLEAEQDNSRVLTARKSEPLGFGQFFATEPGAVHLARIIVAPVRRGCGLGRELVTRLIEAALEARGGSRVTLRVYRDNPAALMLYTRLGFRTVAEESDPQVWFMELRMKSSGAEA
jgi:[ribosomal protein S18]-alanine N-acetyltransferase